jgi:hypothetical protein
MLSNELRCSNYSPFARDNPYNHHLHILSSIIYKQSYFRSNKGLVCRNAYIEKGYHHLSKVSEIKSLLVLLYQSGELTPIQLKELPWSR